MRNWLFLMLLVLVGCSSNTQPPVITQYSLTIEADESVNPTQYNKANPVVVRLYQLTDQQLFLQLPFIDLYNQDTAKLGANLVSSQVLPVVMPGSESQITLDVNSTTQYIAVLAEFSDYQQGETKAVSPLPVEEGQYLKLSLTGSKVELSIVTPESSWWSLF